METYSSGNVVGMTGIPACTIRRYIRDFRSYFSKSAQQPSRGRRYTSDDLRKLLSIRHLYAERKPKDKIIADLAGDWTHLQYRPQKTLDINIKCFFMSIRFEHGGILLKIWIKTN